MKKMKTKQFMATTCPDISLRERENQEKVAEAAAEGMVLLKNANGLLPMAPGSKVAMYGRGVRKTVKGGTGSGSVNERHAVSIYEGMQRAGFVITTDQWLDDYDKSYEEENLVWQAAIKEKSKTMWSYDAFCATPFYPPAGSLPEKTDTDTAIFVVSRIAGENADRKAVAGDYYFTKEERTILTKICALYDHVILVINAGGQLDMSAAEEFPNIEAILIMGMAGMEGGTAFANLLLGKAVPSGKLTDSWPYRYEDLPNAETYSHGNGNTFMEYYHEGIYVGYRYFDTFGVPVRYSFGSGLSYTQFDLKAAAVTWEKGIVHVQAEVTNVGERFSGKEVVQVYATCPCGELPKEYRRLVGFAKTPVLSPGESCTLIVDVSAHMLTSYSERIPSWVLEAGDYYLWLGSSLENARICGVLRLAQTVVTEKTENQCERLAVMQELKPCTELNALRRERCGRVAEAAQVPILDISMCDLEQKTAHYHTNVELGCKETMDFVNGLSEEQLLRLCNGELRWDGTRSTIAGEHKFPGACGETSRCAEPQGLPSLIMADGPAGLRLMSSFKEKDGKLLPSTRMPSYYAGAMVTGPDLSAPVEGEVHRYQYCTAIPTGTQIAQSWNTELAKSLGDLVAGEMEEFGINIWLAPGMNIHRNPLCGRNFEYFSEDPVLTGRMAAAITAGVQAHKGCMVMIKHFACNNQEDNRHFSNSIVSQRPLREIYLKGFEIAVKEAAPMAVMTSYNRLNGVHAANCFDLCSNILRSEWGFDGFIATDWRTTVHDGACTASNCARAGNDVNMPGFELDLRNMKKELRQGTLSIDDVKACVSRLVSAVLRSNLFE